MKIEQTEENYSLENAKIGNIGLYYFGHGNQLSIRVELDGRGWGSTITIPQNKIGEFMEMFDNELDGRVEDGVYIHELSGTPVRVMFNGKSINSRIVGIGDILCNEDDIMMLK